MTFAEMGEQLDLELDESGGSWFNNAEKSAWLNKAVDIFIDKIYRRYEVTQEAKDRLRLLETESAPQSGSIFDLSVVPNYLYLLSLSGDFDITVNGSTTSVNRRIRPQQLDDVTDQDPFGKGVNSDPRYEELGNSVLIKSDTAPSNVKARYLRTPTEADIDGNPTGSFEIPAQFHYEIVDIARDAALENVNSPRYATAKNETNQNLN